MISICALLYDVKYRYEEYLQSISKTKHSKLTESSVVGPRTRVKPANYLLI